MIQQISAAELEKWQTEGRIFRLIDVRESWEREAFSIGGEHIPFDQLNGRTDLMADERPIVFYCRKGIRSQIAIQRLSAKGDVSRCYNLEGGIVKMGQLPSRWSLK